MRRIEVKRWVSDEVGEPTLRDILAELEKPGRDPRSTFEPPRFRDDVQTMGDLKEGMNLEGVVTNVTAFGAFVDVGVHQDGLVHVSQLADRYVEDPREVVKVGDKLNVRVLEVDLERKRISLSARRDAAPGPRKSGGGGASRKGGREDRRPAPRGSERGGGRPAPQEKQQETGKNNPLGDMLKDFLK